MITYFKMKKNEWKVKAMFYSTIVGIMNNKNEIHESIDLMKKIYNELKDIPVNDLRKEFVSKIAELAHEQAIKEQEAEKRKA